MLGFTFPPSPATALPRTTFAEQLQLHFGEETVQLHHVAPAHADGDILVHFTRADVLQMSDTYFSGIYPSSTIPAALDCGCRRSGLAAVRPSHAGCSQSRCCQ